MRTTDQIAWPAARDCPELRGAAVHVWAAEFAAWRGHAEAMFPLLSPDERERANLFRDEERRSRSVVTRGVLRQLLARYCGVSATSLEFTYGPHGKPLLRDTTTGLHFNASHSNTVVVLAFTRAGEIGVDVETIRHAMPRQREIAERYFSPGEFNQLVALPEAERDEAFFRCWTRKEAFLKSRGDGVFGGLETFEVTLDENDARLVRVDGEQDFGAWWMAPLNGIAGHAGAVVARSRESFLSCWRVAPACFAPDQS